MSRRVSRGFLARPFAVVEPVHREAEATQQRRGAAVSASGTWTVDLPRGCYRLLVSGLTKLFCALSRVDK